MIKLIPNTPFSAVNTENLRIFFFYECCAVLQTWSQWTKINKRSEGTSMDLHVLGEPCNQHLSALSNILSLCSHYDNQHTQYPEPKAQRSDAKLYSNSEEAERDEKENGLRQGGLRERGETSIFTCKFRDNKPKMCSKPSN